MAHLSIEPNERITYRVHYEDEHLLVVSKPPRIVTQPGKGHERDSLLNGVFATHGPRLQNLGQKLDFGLLHRLDREASGLVIIALSAPAYDAMRSAFASRTIAKFYWALAGKTPARTGGVIRKPIVEAHPTATRQKTASISSTGKPALTAWRLVTGGESGSLIEARPITGRLHQVRVHLASIGCPILGDTLYAPRRMHHAAPRLALHAHRLIFTHPITGEALDIRTRFPHDLRPTLRRLGLSLPQGDPEARPTVEDPISGSAEDGPPRPHDGAAEADAGADHAPEDLAEDGADGVDDAGLDETDDLQES